MKRVFPSAALFMLFILPMSNSQAQEKKLGLFTNEIGVGNPSKPGSTRYDAGKEEYLIEGSGANIWADHDQFHFVWKKIKGNFIVSTRAALLGKGVDPHRKFGWMVRTTLDSSSTHVNAVVHGDGLTSLQFRRNNGDVTQQRIASITGADIIQLERRGNKYIMSVAKYGDTFVTQQVDSLSLGDEVYVGLFVCAHNKDVYETALFHNVRVVIPAADNFVPYRDYIGSNIEIMDVASGYRKTIHYEPRSLQAPNWTPDNKYLIYNAEGLLYKYDLKKNAISKLNTGFAIDNNNDHVLSFDGKMIAISNHVGEKRISTLFTLPVSGSDKPSQITAVESGHSYLHGWSPDGKKLVFTGQRNSQFDIWTIDIETKKETALTNTPGLDDGPEYSPDGKYIYFNSTRSGLMQIWRMKADGSDPEQITNDEYNNWFPHFSPDGKWIVIISYSKEVKPDDHPFYKQVYLRLMPASGGTPKVIAYVYGGQGTINVPSWSPDGKKIAFVSNTDKGN